MQILVAYASKHGSTRGLAEAVGDGLTRAGHPADVRRVQDVDDLGGYDAFVIGAATYAMHWRKEAVAFVHQHEELLRHHPVWLFSSGPLGTGTTDDEGRDLREVSDPKEFPELTAAVAASGTRVFFGALDPTKLGAGERAIRKLPAGRALLPAGDFRDWSDVATWTGEIAEEIGHLTGTTASGY